MPRAPQVDSQQSFSPARGPRLAVILLLALGLITLLGTFAAARDGVLAAQERYFDALVVWQPIAGALVLPLPGARSLLFLLALALVLDRRAWSWRKGRRALVLVHAGVLGLLGSGLWSASTRVERVAVGSVGARVEPQPAVPFSLRVANVRRAYEPRGNRLRRFEVEVEVDGASSPARIDLNRPLSRGGWTVYLRGEEPGLRPPKDPVELVFVRDPADPLRLAAAIAVAAGLLLHFLGVLLRQRWHAAQG